MASRGLLVGGGISFGVALACSTLGQTAALPTAGHAGANGRTAFVGAADPLTDAVQASSPGGSAPDAAAGVPGPGELSALVQAALDRRGRFPADGPDLRAACAVVREALAQLVAQRFDAHNPIQTNHALSRLFPGEIRVRAGAWIVAARVSVGRHDDADAVPAVTAEFFDTLRQDTETGRPKPQALVFSADDS